MKTQFIYFFGLLLFVAVSCKNNPSHKAEKKSEKFEHEANAEAKVAEKQLEHGMDHVDKAAEAAIMSEANDMLSKVPMPEVESIAAKASVKEIGDEFVDFVNSKSEHKAESLSDHIVKHLNGLDKKVDKGLMTAEDAAKIRSYANNLAAAVGLEINL